MKQEGITPTWSCCSLSTWYETKGLAEASHSLCRSQTSDLKGPQKKLVKERGTYCGLIVLLSKNDKGILGFVALISSNGEQNPSDTPLRDRLRLLSLFHLILSFSYRLSLQDKVFCYVALRLTARRTWMILENYSEVLNWISVISTLRTLIKQLSTQSTYHCCCWLWHVVSLLSPKAL